jgi:hypothetical protein
MKIYKFILGVFTVLLLVSFSGSNDKISLEKVWVYDSYEDGTYTYISKKKFDKDKSGYEFMKDSIIKVRQNSGWCGTPPIDYEIVRGKWSMASDSILRIEHPVLGSKTTLKLKILKLTQKELVLKYLR